MLADPKLPFGRRLAALRKARGWSQEDLAAKSGLSSRYIGDVERGKRNIGLVNICRIAAAIGITAAKLMSFEER